MCISENDSLIPLPCNTCRPTKRSQQNEDGYTYTAENRPVLEFKKPDCRFACLCFIFICFEYAAFSLIDGLVVSDGSFMALVLVNIDIRNMDIVFVKNFKHEFCRA